jgi:hypothetical protein
VEGNFGRGPSARIQKKLINDTNITGLRKFGKFLMRSNANGDSKRKKNGTKGRVRK